MKDAYSFDLSEDDAVLSYNKMFFAHSNFERLGLSRSNESRHRTNRRDLSMNLILVKQKVKFIQIKVY